MGLGGLWASAIIRAARWSLPVARPTEFPSRRSRLILNAFNRQQRSATPGSNRIRWPPRGRAQKPAAPVRGRKIATRSGKRHLSETDRQPLTPIAERDQSTRLNRSHHLDRLAQAGRLASVLSGTGCVRDPLLSGRSQHRRPPSHGLRRAGRLDTLRWPGRLCHRQ